MLPVLPFVRSIDHRVYLSADDALDAGDVQLTQLVHTEALAAGDDYVEQTTVTLPQAISGEFHLFVSSDVGAKVFEYLFEDNNDGRTAAPIAITRRPDPDLVVTPMMVDGPTAGQPGQTVTVTWEVRNDGDSDVSNPKAGIN